MGLNDNKLTLFLGESGFTLSELLIALAILGVIATFTIPKIIAGQQSEKYNATAKEAIATLSQALLQYKASGLLNANTGGWNLTPYLNYVNIDTISQLNWENGQAAPLNCSNGNYLCLQLHNGGALWTFTSLSFGGSSSLNAILWFFDPDGQYVNSSESASASIIQYYNGRILTRGTCLVGSVYNSGTITCPAPALDPPWFHW